MAVTAVQCDERERDDKATAGALEVQQPGSAASGAVGDAEAQETEVPSADGRGSCSEARTTRLWALKGQVSQHQERYPDNRCQRHKR